MRSLASSIYSVSAFPIRGESSVALHTSSKRPLKIAAQKGVKRSMPPRVQLRTQAGEERRPVRKACPERSVRTLCEGTPFGSCRKVMIQRRLAFTQSSISAPGVRRSRVAPRFVLWTAILQRNRTARTANGEGRSLVALHPQSPTRLLSHLPSLADLGQVCQASSFTIYPSATVPYRRKAQRGLAPAVLK